MADPVRGEIWRVNFDPTQGSEMRKIRPALVISDNKIGRLPLKLVVPITEWDSLYQRYPWMVRLEPKTANGLSKTSSADAFQIRSVSLEPVMHFAAQFALICLWQPLIWAISHSNPRYPYST